MSLSDNPKLLFSVEPCVNVIGYSIRILQDLWNVLPSFSLARLHRQSVDRLRQLDAQDAMAAKSNVQVQQLTSLDHSSDVDS